MAWVILDINMHKIIILKLKYIVPIVFLLVAFPFFFLGGPSDYSSSLFRSVWDCGHLVFFIALVIVLSKKFELRNWCVGLAISAAVFVGGGLIELIQSHVGRDGSWNDLLRDLTGTWLGLFWAQRANKWIWLGRVLTVALLIPNLSSVFYEARYQLNAIQQFPLLAGYESNIELYGHGGKIELSSQFHTQGDYALKVALTTKQYSGIVFRRMINDWSAYKTLSFDIYNPDPPLFNMTVRVNDVQHKQSGWATSDRFNRTFSLNQGWNHLSFSLDDIRDGPAKRQMDMSQIMWVEIFVEKLPVARTIYLDNLRLE
jgi:VanZ family protein